MVDGLKGLGVLETDEDPTASCHAPFQQGDSPLPAHTQTHTLHIPITSCIHTECLILREQTRPNNYVTTQNIPTV